MARLQKKLKKSEKFYNLCSEIHISLEEQIKLAPEQYLWIHDRYRIRPDSEQNND